MLRALSSVSSPHEGASPFADLAARWRHARRAALRELVPDATDETPDADLTDRALRADAARAEKRVFENSLLLGRGFARYHGEELSLGDLPRAFPELRSPCTDGVWEVSDDEPALTLVRPGCSEGGRTPQACGLWREAISGLVLGLTGGILHSRIESIHRGGARCADVLHVDPESPLRIGPIPPAIARELESVTRVARTFDSTQEVEFLGLSEGVLLYRVHKGTGSRLDVTSLVTRTVSRRLPGLRAQECSPRAVFADGA